MSRTRNVLGGALAAGVLVLGTTTGLAAAQAAATGHEVSTCDNPTLNKDLAGWGALAGGVAPFRYPLFGTAGEHVNAPAAYVAANNTAPNPRAYLPQTPVRAGAAQTFAVDTRTDMQGRGRVEVDWYSATGAFVGHTDGPWTSLPGGQPFTWRTLTGDFTPPAGAARANVLSGAELPAGADFSLTGCSYLPAGGGEDPPPVTDDPDPTSTEEPPPSTEEPPPTTTEPPPAGDGTSAAAARGWGTPVAGDEFNYTGAPNSRWGMYNGPGHAGQGTRSPSAFHVDGTKLVVSGSSNGTTGGMAYQGGQYRGKWEARMRVPRGDSEYHPVLILWPDAEDFPVGGEVDYAETNTAATKVDFFLHYGASNSQTHGEKAVDLTQWHNYAVSWDAGCITGYVDNQQFFQDCNPSHLPPRKMHMTVQLDWFPDGTATAPSSMEVDWIRQYAP